MRTRPCEGVLRCDVTDYDPRPQVVIAYDGLAGLEQRPILRDILDELERKGPTELRRFVDALRTKRSGRVQVYFSDYVSYGIGGGDATSEFYFREMLLWHEPAKPETETDPAVPEHLVLRRNPASCVALEYPVWQQQIEREGLQA